MVRPSIYLLRLLQVAPDPRRVFFRSKGFVDSVFARFLAMNGDSVPGFRPYRQRLIAASFMALCALIPALSAAETQPPRTLSLADCVQSSLEHNFDLKVQRYNPALASNNIHLAYGDYDPVFSMTGVHDYSRQPAGFDGTGSRYDGTTTKTDSFIAQVSDRLPSGATVSLGADLSDSYGHRPSISTNGIYSGRSLFDSSRGTVTFLQLQQPLLRNLWTDATRLNIRLRRHDLKTSELVLRQLMMNVVFNVEQTYYALIAARENIKVQEKALELAQRLYDENQQKVKIGVMAPLDEKQAQSQVASSQSSLITAERAYSAQENILKNLITDDYEKIHQIAFVPSEDLRALNQPFDLQESWNSAFNHRADLHQLIVDLERRQASLRYDRNQLFPQLDLIGTYGHNALSDEFSGSLGQFANGSGPFYSVGATISVPFTNRKARDTYRATRLEQAQAQDKLKQFRQTVMVQVDDAIKESRASLRRVGATREAREYAEAALQAEQDKFRAGTSTVFLVLQFQRNLTTARSEEIGALADYNKAISNLGLREGTILGRNRIDIEVK